MQTPRILRSCFSCCLNVQTREQSTEVVPVKSCIKRPVVNASENPRLIEKNLEERHVVFCDDVKIYEEDSPRSQGSKKLHRKVFEEAVVILKQKRFPIRDFKKYIHTFTVCNNTSKDELFVSPVEKLLRTLRRERETALEKRTSGLSNDVLDNAVIALCEEVGRHMGVFKAQEIIVPLVSESTSTEYVTQALQDDISSIKKGTYSLHLNDLCISQLEKECALKTLKKELETAILELKGKDRAYEYSDWNRIEQRRKGLAGTQLPVKITKKYWEDLPTSQSKSGPYPPKTIDCKETLV